MIGLHISPEELRKLLVDTLRVVSAADFDKAADMARRFRVPLERALVERTGMPTVFLLKQLAEAWDVRFIDLKVTDVEREALDLVPDSVARAHVVMPFKRSGHELQVATTNPHDDVALEVLAAATGLTIVPVLAAEIAIRRAHLLYRKEIREILDGPAVTSWGEAFRVGRKRGRRSRSSTGSSSTGLSSRLPTSTSSRTSSRRSCATGWMVLSGTC